MRAVLLFLIACGCCAPIAQAAEPAEHAAEFSTEQVEFFEQQVLPILQRRCFDCHGPEAQPEGRLYLTSRASILRGGELGPSAEPGAPDESLLIQALRYEGLEMPPSEKLPAAEVETLVQWVREGLPWSPATADDLPELPEHESAAPREPYWAYQPVVEPAVPQVANAAWVQTPIDAFLLAALEQADLQPAPPADRTALLRRVTYDLTGLPPTPEEVAAFLADDAPDAYVRLVERLLASPQYGEKWARHWLDLVRYAETNGYERDNPKPFAWRYRDYVIRAFADDKPYDEFLREQLAGDELDAVTADSLIATGYYRLGIWDDEPADPPLARYDVLDGIVSTTGSVMLGMSLGCARCHDHKRDPLLQRDYYSLLACFHDIAPMNGDNTRRFVEPGEQAAYEAAVRAKEQREAALYAQLYAWEQEFARQLAARGLAPASAVVSADLTELRYTFYRDSWETLPDFNTVKAEATGPVERNYFSLRPASRKEAFGLVFSGSLRVPQAGRYTFDLQVTGGARLIVDGQTVLAAPQRGTHDLHGAADLPGGLLDVRLEYFNLTDEPRLQVAWSGPGFDARPLSDPETAAFLAADARTGEVVWQYTTTAPQGDWTAPDFAPGDWQQGPAGFGAVGTPGAIVRTPWQGTGIWLRRQVALEQLPAALALDVHHDEDVQVYLNGRLVYEANGYTVEYQRVPLGDEALAALHPGDNTLAVHCRQTGGGQYIDVGLVTGQAAVPFEQLLEEFGPQVAASAERARYQALRAELEQSRATPVPEPGLQVMCVSESGPVRTHILRRGLPQVEGDEVSPAVPEVLVADGQAALAYAPRLQSAGKRLALAEWIVDPANPLTARVMANRIWQFHFGRGIVPTPNDFGLLGELPTNQPLLDWLAVQFIQSGWSIKAMHRLILHSSAYQMSSAGSADGLADDPGNTLFWRFPMRRLTAEELRDSILQVGGQLNLTQFGPSIYPPIPQEVLAGQSVPGQGWTLSAPQDQVRRSVYVHVKRSLLLPILASHDAADTDGSCPVRYTTTVATQALELLNGEFLQEQARALAQRLQREAPDDQAAQVELGLRLTVCRAPRAEEVQADLQLIADLQEAGLSADEALARYCLVLLNANEFVYLD